MNGDSALDLVGTIYEAAYDERLWPEVLRRLTGRLHAVGMTLLGSLGDRAPVQIFQTWGHDPALIKRYTEFYSRFDLCLPRAAALPPGSVSDDRHLMSEEELRSNPFYNELMADFGLTNIGGVTILGGGPEVVQLTYQRGPRAGRPKAREEELLRTLSPHVRRALRLHQQLGGLLLDRATAWGALDLLDRPVFVATGKGKLAYANRAARELLDRRDGLTLSNGRLICATSRATAALERLLVAATQLGSVAVGGALTIERIVGRPLELAVAPLPENSSAPLSPSPLAAIFVADPDHQVNAPEFLLRQRYRLTAAESRVAQSLMEGLSLTEAAERLMITHNTARVHLRHVFEKTGVRRQVALVRLLLSSTPASR